MIKEHFMRLSKRFAWVNLQEVKFVRQGRGVLVKPQCLSHISCFGQVGMEQVKSHGSATQLVNECMPCRNLSLSSFIYQLFYFALLNSWSSSPLWAPDFRHSRRHFGIVCSKTIFSKAQHLLLHCVILHQLESLDEVSSFTWRLMVYLMSGVRNQRCVTYVIMWFQYICDWTKLVAWCEVLWRAVLSRN